MTIVRIKAKAARKVTWPKPQPLSTHMSTQEVDRMPGTGPQKAPCDARHKGLPLLTHKHLHPCLPPLFPSRYLLCGW